VKLGTFVEVLDVINHASFHFCVMSSLEAGGGSKRGFGFEIPMALTNNIALRFRAGKW
jgi:hypothetical protein